MDDGLKWRVIVGEPQTAAEQMATDARLAEESMPTVRLFTWSPPAVSLGWKQPSPDWLRGGRWAASSCELVERPTGGGIAFHGSDLSLADVIPRNSHPQGGRGVPGAVGDRPGSHQSLETLMRAVCQSAVSVCRTYGADATAVLEAPSAGRITYCLTEINPYAVVVGTRKVAGFALRRYPRSWLIQGSLLVQSLPRVLADALPVEVGQQLASRAVPLSQVSASPVTPGELATRWAEHWSAWWGEAADPATKLSAFSLQLSAKTALAER